MRRSRKSDCPRSGAAFPDTQDDDFSNEMSARGMVPIEKVGRQLIVLLPLKHRRVRLAADTERSMDRQLNEQIGCCIAKFRKRHRMTQEDFAYDIGLTRGFLSDIERGTRSISVETLARICGRTGMTPNKLLGV